MKFKLSTSSQRKLYYSYLPYCFTYNIISKFLSKFIDSSSDSDNTVTTLYNVQDYIYAIPFAKADTSLSCGKQWNE